MSQVKRWHGDSRVKLNLGFIFLLRTCLRESESESESERESESESERESESDSRRER